MIHPIASPILDGVRGRIGSLVFRRFAHRTLVQRAPNMTGLPVTPAQRAQRERFKQAVEYARTVTRDPSRKAPYASRAQDTGSNPMALCVADYLNPPEVQGVDLSAYTGRAGQTIGIAASDDFEVTTVEVVITSGHGRPLERGHAALDPATECWVYTTSVAVPVVPRVAIEVTAVDRAGNRTRRTEWFG